jgi:hypothetical protein
MSARILALAVPGAMSATALAQQYAPGFGPSPQLPAPQKSLIPTMNIAPAEPWPQGTRPTPAPAD